MVFIKDFYQLTGKIMTQVEHIQFMDTFSRCVALEPELDAQVKEIMRETLAIDD